MAMDESVTTIVTSIAAQGPFAAFMFWQVIQFKQDSAAKDKRLDELMDVIIAMTKESIAAITKNNDAISALPGAFYALKGSVDAIQK